MRTPVRIPGLQVEDHEHHRLRGEAGVTRGKAQPPLLQSVLHLFPLGKEIRVAQTGVVGHEDRIAARVGAVDAAPVGSAHVDEVRPQPADAVLAQVGQALRDGRAQAVAQHDHVQVGKVPGDVKDVAPQGDLRVGALSAVVHHARLHDEDGQGGRQQPHGVQHRRRHRGAEVGVADALVVAEEAPLVRLADEVEEEDGQTNAEHDQDVEQAQAERADCHGGR